MDSHERRLEKAESAVNSTDKLPKPPPYLDVRTVRNDLKPLYVHRVWMAGPRAGQQEIPKGEQ